jgi:hypothetical protein
MRGEKTCSGEFDGGQRREVLRLGCDDPVPALDCSSLPAQHLMCANR